MDLPERMHGQGSIVYRVIEMDEPKYIVTLDNGETYTQDGIDGSVKSPWQQIIDYCNTYDHKITSIRVQVNGVTYMSPSTSDKAKFRSNHLQDSFHSNQQMVWRGSHEHNLSTGQQDGYHRIHFGIEKPCEVIQWIDINTGDSWIQIKARE